MDIAKFIRFCFIFFCSVSFFLIFSFSLTESTFFLLTDISVSVNANHTSIKCTKTAAKNCCFKVNIVFLGWRIV